MRVNVRIGEDEAGQRGSALVIAVLVVVILTLLGVSFLLMADTENRIAENEKLSAQALYFGEAGVRQVKRWFDSPGSSSNLMNAPLNVIDRTLRLIDDDGDPGTSPHPQDGSTWPRYKQGIDLNADGSDDVFDKPYRGSLRHALLGTEGGPDMRIAETASSAAKTFLTNLSNALMANFPAASAGIRARITQIDVFAPPYVSVGGSWTRYGMATVRVVARIYRINGTTEQVLAERVVRAVLNETPYPGPFGPLHSCDELEYTGSFNVHWGTVTAVSASDVPNNWDNKMWKSIPRASSQPSARIDLLYGISSPGEDAIWTALRTNLEGGVTIRDPWFRYLAGAEVQDWVSEPDQVDAPITTDQDHSNLFHRQAGISCPDFDYDTWKTIATSGGENVHYYVWDNGSSFKENALGTAQDFETLTDGKTGLFFFDTKDGNRPSDTLDGDGAPINNTPRIKIQGGSYGVRGFLYLNTVLFSSQGSPGRTTTFTLPGEPFRDVNQNGVRDAGEDWINLNYNSITGLFDSFQGSATDDFGNPGGGRTYNAVGPSITDTAMVWGVLYNSGNFDAQGTPKYYGSVITKTGAPGSAGTADIFWDESLKTNWPPPGWDLPRVVITRWETDL